MSRRYTPRYAQTAGDLSFPVQFNDDVRRWFDPWARQFQGCYTNYEALNINKLPIKTKVVESHYDQLRYHIFNLDGKSMQSNYAYALLK